MSLFMSVDCFKGLPLISGITLRYGGVSTKGYSSLNMGFNSGDDKEAVLENRQRLYHELGLTSESFVYANQAHGNNIEIINTSHKGRGSLSSADAIENIDGMITDKKGIVLAIQTADCMSIFIYCKKSRTAALLHAGWKGTKLNIAGKAVKMMEQEYNASPSDMVCYLGPSICSENYKVGDEFYTYFDKEFLEERNGGIFFDIKRANRNNLLNAGVKNIYAYNGCTFAQEGNFFSYRRDGFNTGRMLSFISLE
jgi:YfiH family protein